MPWPDQRAHWDDPFPSSTAHRASAEDGTGRVESKSIDTHRGAESPRHAPIAVHWCDSVSDRPGPQSAVGGPYSAPHSWGHRWGRSRTSLRTAPSPVGWQSPDDYAAGGAV